MICALSLITWFFVKNINTVCMKKPTINKNALFLSGKFTFLKIYREVNKMLPISAFCMPNLCKNMIMRTNICNQYICYIHIVQDTLYQGSVYRFSQCTVFGRKSKHKTDVTLTGWHGIHFHKKIYIFWS